MSTLHSLSGDQQQTIVRAIDESYGVRIDHLERLGGEVDWNFEVAGTANEKYLLRLTPEPADMNEIEWQEKVLVHLEKRPASVDFPRMMLQKDGALHSPLALEDGQRFVVRLFHWVPGEVVAKVGITGRHYRTQLGELAAELTSSLSELMVSATRPDHHWMVVRSGDAIRETVSASGDAIERGLLLHALTLFDAVKERIPQLPSSVVHQDLNDFNLLASRDELGRVELRGVVDFNDAVYTVRIAELAIAAAYAALRQEDAFGAFCDVVQGYLSRAKLTDTELELLYPLAVARLAVNASTWTYRSSGMNGDYAKSRIAATWPALEQLLSVHPSVAADTFRKMAGTLAPHDDLSSSEVVAAAIVASPIRHLNLSPNADFVDGVDFDSAAITAAAKDAVYLLGDRVGVTLPFSAVVTESAVRGVGSTAPKTILNGIGVSVARETELMAPAQGTVESVADDRIVVRHDIDGVPVYSVWLGGTPLVAKGDSISAGERVVRVGTPDNAPTVLAGIIQFFRDPNLIQLAAPAFVRAFERDYWASQFDVRLAAPLINQFDVGDAWNQDRVLKVRAERFAPSQKSYYDHPMTLVRGRGVWLMDSNAQIYLDSINNVTHVGHANDRIADATYRQMRRLNTNSRFVYPQISQYAERLTSLLPDKLDTVFFVCTGSEANDLALRIARQVTGKEQVLVIDSAYHGNTRAVTDVSPNRYQVAGNGVPEGTREVPTPDAFRGPYRYGDPDLGHKYAALVGEQVDALVAEGTPPAAFIAESLIGTGGNYVLPEGYLQESYQRVRDVGGLCIADEVQIGFGRLGTHYWGFETQGVVPDIVTMGKPIGNGHPLAAVVTTREIAEAFDNGVKYFNTFGGNPVSCVVGMTVLDILEDDNLQQHALRVGGYFKEQLEQLQRKHWRIGDVRGYGLYLGVELVESPGTTDPDKRAARIVSEMLKDRGVIMFPNGRYDNVLKIKPPMVFDESHVDKFIQTFDIVLDIYQSE